MQVSETCDSQKKIDTLQAENGMLRRENKQLRDSLTALSCNSVLISTYPKYYLLTVMKDIC